MTDVWIQYTEISHRPVFNPTGEKVTQNYTYVMALSRPLKKDTVRSRRPGFQFTVIRLFFTTVVLTSFPFSIFQTVRLTV